MSIEFTDIFCGAGGSSIGLAAAGLNLRIAANHWDRAIETHSANFPDADHLVADVSNYDMRRLPRTDVLWASPECTWHSPAGGRKQASKMRAQLDMFDDYVANDGGVRSRATAFDVIRAAEVHQYKVIIVENVVEFAQWEMFDWWLDGLRKLGYTCQLISVSSAHIGDETNRHAPQWRDRLYVYCTAKGIAAPDVRPRPIALCPTCGVVRAIQAWKPNRHIGKYGLQYVYRCPNQACSYTLVEPFVLPAAAAIDWSDIGTRIGERTKPLAEATMRRIRAGLELFAQPVELAVHGNTFERPGYTRAWPIDESPLSPFLLDRYQYDNEADHRFVHDPAVEPAQTITASGRSIRTLVHPPLSITVNHDSDGRVYPVEARPLDSRTGKVGDGLLVPFVTTMRKHSSPESVDEAPLASVTAGGNHHGLTVPPGAERRHPVSLVIPYRRARARTTTEPLHTVATKDSAAIVKPAIEVDDCYFRMLQPREQARAQRFPDSYQITGNRSEQTMQAGNAVSSNVAQWLGEITAEVLGGAA